MTTSEQTIASFQLLTRQLILRFQELKKENDELHARIEKNGQDMKLLQEKIAQQERDYQSLMMAKMIEITDGDLQAAKDRLAKLIRDVNKSIAILSDESG